MDLSTNPLHQFLQLHLYGQYGIKKHHQEGVSQLLSHAYMHSEGLRHVSDVSNGYIMIITRNTKRHFFGSSRKFDEINDQLGGVFEQRIDHNRLKNQAKGYGISKKMGLLLEQFEIAWLNDEFNVVQGEKIRKVKTPIQSQFTRKMKGKIPVKVNAKVTHKDANLPYMIPIDVDSVFDLAKAAYVFLPKYSERFFQQKDTALQTQALMRLINKTKHTDTTMNVTSNVREIYQSWIDGAKTIKEMMAMFRHVHEIMTKALALRYVARCYDGFVPIQYTESPQGRLYAKKYYPNLQTVPREVRKAALSDCYDIDLDNCHYVLLWNKAKQIGVNLPSIEYYNNHKSFVRKTLAEDLKMPIEKVKEAMLSLMFGAEDKYETRLNSTTKKVGAIGEIFGSEENVKRFTSHYLMEGILADLEKGGKAVVKHYIQHHQNKNGFITNDYGVTASLKGAVYKNGNVKPKSQRKLLSFILQGAERTVLDIMIECLDGTKIMLLQHDGLTYCECLTREQLNLIQQSVLDKTGLEVKIGDCEPLRNPNIINIQDIAA